MASAFNFYLLGIIYVGILFTNQDSRLIHAAQISKTQDAAIEQKATALYADAANFQRGQAYDIAIESWTAFLDKYPQSKLATSASYYLGVCYMQKAEPDYESAVTAFERTLKVDGFDLRQESLANLAWCLYQQGIAGVEVNSSLLEKSLSILNELIDSKPTDLQIGQALFYSGEICYRLGDQNRAISFYDQFLSSQSAESPLWADALYGKGVAQEESKQNTEAIKTYTVLVKSNPNSRLIVDVRIRLGDLYILNKNFNDAIEQFQLASQTAQLDTDRSYAIFREAFSLVQLDQYEEASKRYSELIANYPDSSLAQPAQLAKAQSFFRAGKIDLAEIEFEIIREGDELAASTEAVHWLARIKISQGKNDEAIAITSAQIAEGLEGEFSIPVRLDLADAMAAGKTSEAKTKAKQQYFAIYSENANHPLAPRSLFNAAVLSLQLGNPREALTYSDQFIEAFPTNHLQLEITYIKAESHNQLDELELASAEFSQLVSTTPADHPKRSEWILRAANTWNLAGKAEKTIAMLVGNLSIFTKANPRAESLLLIGQAYRSLSQFEEAIKALEKSVGSARNWDRRPELLLTLGLALKDSKQTKEALSTLQALIKEHPISEYSQQARYELASIFRDQRRFDDSIALYDQILQSSDSQELLNYARYGKGWCLMQSNQYESVIETLSPLLALSDNPISFDARLTRGIAYRESNDYSSAMNDFEACLEIANDIE
ncbi:MAG: tetratricopeptide repeat protein, partial [Planctomycetota bacterium]|nr:tetratricopeptide repeat protein [Planctomycetota bacterium]